MTTPTQHPASTSDARKRAADLATPDRGGDLRGALDLDAIRARVDAATGGPWIAAGHTVYGAEPGDQVAECDWRPDATFIRHARTDVLTLLAEVERLTRLLGSHTDGSQCTCWLVNGGTHLEPPEWEQDPWCPTHPDVSQIRPEFERRGAERDAAREALARAEALDLVCADGCVGPGLCDGSCIRAALALPATDEGAGA